MIAGQPGNASGIRVLGLDRQGVVYRLHVPDCASWIQPQWLEQQRRTLPPHVFEWLHMCRWVDGVGAYLTVSEVDSVFTDPPHGSGLVAIGLDLGLTRDRTVAAVVRNVNEVLCIEHLVTWQGRRGEKVDLREVEEEVRVLAQRFGGPVWYDPYQATLLAQRLTAQGVSMREYIFSGEARRRLFTTILDLVRGQRLRSRPHPELRAELLGLEATESAAGWRVDHRVGKHDDHVIATALACQAIAKPHTELTPEMFSLATDRAAAVQAFVSRTEPRLHDTAPWFDDEGERLSQTPEQKRAEDDYKARSCAQWPGS